MRARDALNKKRDFKSRRHKQADLNVRGGDYSKAMESLLKVDSKVSLSAIESAIKEPLPPRSRDELSVEQRQALFTYVESSSDDFLLTRSDVLYRLKKMKKSRSPGLDGVTVERLNSALLGGNRDDAYKRETLSDYATLLNRCVKRRSLQLAPNALTRKARLLIQRRARCE